MTVSPDRIRISPSPQDLAQAAAEHIESASAEAVAERGRFVVALAGGSTPKRLYELLARRNRCNWSSWYVMLGDERVVPPEHSESNAALVSATLLDRVPIPSSQCVLPQIAEGDDHRGVAEAYDARLRQLFADSGGVLDLAILGLGSDGHTASLFPKDRTCLEEKRRLVCPATAPPDAPIRERITLTYPVLQQARTVIFLITGESKRHVAAELLAGSGRRSSYPAARFIPVLHAYWYLDAVAAAGLPALTG